MMPSTSFVQNLPLIEKQRRGKSNKARYYLMQKLTLLGPFKKEASSEEGEEYPKAYQSVQWEGG